MGSVEVQLTVPLSPAPGHSFCARCLSMGSEIVRHCLMMPRHFLILQSLLFCRADLATCSQTICYDRWTPDGQRDLPSEDYSYTPSNGFPAQPSLPHKPCPLTLLFVFALLRPDLNAFMGFCNGADSGRDVQGQWLCPPVGQGSGLVEQPCQCFKS